MKNNKGITLIALVITIIVMLILVGVTISMAVNGGLFNYAGNAVRETNTKKQEEGKLAEGGIEVNGEWYNTIDEYLNRDKETTDTPPTTGTTLVSLWEAGELEIGAYVDYNPNTGITTVNPDNPNNEENVAVGALTGYGAAAQSVAYESLKWRVLGYDETKDEIVLISATPTTAGLNFYGHVGYNNYEDVLETVCSKLYSNSSIGATARSITMDDIDTYLGGSAYPKTSFGGGSTTAGGYGYSADIISRFQYDKDTETLELVADEGTVTLDDLTSTGYYYTASDVITDTTKLEILQSTNATKPYYYWVASRSMGMVTGTVDGVPLVAGAFWSSICVYMGTVGYGALLIISNRSRKRGVMCVLCAPYSFSAIYSHNRRGAGTRYCADYNLG